ncbi:MAG TPA: LamG-like jellyroll fold domain-containing protein [Sedimentisphaerales bacterium]|nr:LamG-like jellyroll fold domain-containing protein [Sedimentisphaerales bacterium]
MMNTKVMMWVPILIVGALAATCVQADIASGLVGHWAFNGDFTDSSGNGNHGQAIGDTVVMKDPEHGFVAEFDGTGDYIEIPHSETLNITGNEITLATWAYCDDVTGPPEILIAKVYRETTHANPYFSYGLHFLSNGQPRFWLRLGTANRFVPATVGMIQSQQWYHVAGVYTGSQMILYVNGEAVATGNFSGTITGYNTVLRLGTNGGLTEQMDGKIDDVRIYNRALSVEDIAATMVGAPAEVASSPTPADGALHEAAWASLSWSPGAFAVSHDIYIGTNFADVNDATLGSAAFLQNTAQNQLDIGMPGQPFPGGLEPGATYYWRIDEVNDVDPNSPWKGDVWSFTVAEYLVVDNFEDYTDSPGSEPFTVWLDGFLTAAAGGNGSGGIIATNPADGQVLLETADRHGGAQAVPFFYNNTGISAFDGQPRLMYSQVERSWATPQDWTVKGLEELAIWYKGVAGPGSVSFDAATQTYTMTGAGSNVWAAADEFHFAYKELTGNGSITVRVDSIPVAPHGDPRIGVMIRDTLDPSAKNATLFVEPDPRTRFTARLQDGGNTADSAVLTDTPLPTWIRLTREGYTVRAERSTNGVTWSPVTADLAVSSTQVSLTLMDPVYIGLVVCSHASQQFAEATFSNVSTTGTMQPAGPFTSSQDIGIASNATEPLYAAINGIVVTNEDPAAVNVTQWTQWSINLSAVPGLNPAAVTTLAIGVGNPLAPQAGGTGRLLLDDIRVRRSSPVDPGVDGLVAQYSFENNVEDGSGNGHNGTLVGDPAYVQGLAGYGMALDFDGADDVVELGKFDVVGRITLAAWVRADDFEINDARIVSKAREWGSNDHWWMLSTVLSGADYVPRFRLKTDESDTVPTLIGAGGVLAVGEWSHVTATWDGASMVLYVDGVEVGRTPKGGSAVAVDPTVSVAIGSQPSDAFATDPAHVVKFFDGLIDEVRIYNRALSELEVRYLAE